MVRKTLLAIVVIMTIVVAGQNKDAQLHMDMDVSTSAIESEAGCPAESTIVTTVRVSGASKLYSYQFYIEFDTSSLAFISGKRGDEKNANFLEKNDGSASFSAKISKKDSTRILVGNYLSGDESSQCVSGDGPLGLFTFRHKKKDTTTLVIRDSKLLDCDLNEDTAKKSESGRITPSAIYIVTNRAGLLRNAPRVAIRNGVVAITFDRATEYLLTVVNTLGKRKYSSRGRSTQIKYDFHTQAYKHGVPQLLLLRISYNGQDMVIPVLN